MRMPAPHVILERLAIPGQHVIDYPGSLRRRQARGVSHPVDEVAVHRPIVLHHALDAKFLPEFGQNSGIRTHARLLAAICLRVSVPEVVIDDEAPRRGPA